MPDASIASDTRHFPPPRKPGVLNKLKFQVLNFFKKKKTKTKVLQYFDEYRDSPELASLLLVAPNI